MCAVCKAGSYLTVVSFHLLTAALFNQRQDDRSHTVIQDTLLNVLFKA